MGVSDGLRETVATDDWLEDSDALRVKDSVTVGDKLCVKLMLPQLVLDKEGEKLASYFNL